MSRSDALFIGHRLTEAREVRGTTKQELADLLGKTHQTVTSYENGSYNPAPEVIDDICRILKLPLSFFTIDRTDSLINAPIQFRSLKSAHKVKKLQIERWLQWVANRVGYYKQYMDFPPVNLPKFDLDFGKLSESQIENIAESVRKFWGLGNGPISNLTLLLENNGIIVTHYNFEVKGLDACSTIANGLPLILINTFEATCSRILMDLAHELGHLVLHADVDKDEITPAQHKQMEDQAWDFAAAFLMPADGFSCEVVDTRLTAFALLKRRWRVSIAGMIMRCRELCIIDDFRKTYLFKEMNRRKIRLVEPLDNELKIETPHLLIDAEKLLTESGELTKWYLLDASYISADDYCSIVGTPTDYFKRETVQPKLRPDYIRIVK